MADHNQPIIVKKIKKAAHGHHGGAWKIAYADFVTAMMAFFLLMWLINMTTEEQKKGLAEYFAPEAVSANTSGSGGPMGGSSIEDEGSLKSGYSPKDIHRTPPTPKSASDRAGQTGDQGRSAGDPTPAVAEQFESAAASVRQALRAMPEVTPYQDNVLVEVTEDGLQIIIMDSEWRPMFARGSKVPLEPTRVLMSAIAPILTRLSADVTITGHTAAGSGLEKPDYGPWELSADRANAVRAILTEFGLPDGDIKSVTARAATDPYFIDDPFMAANDRVAVSVLFPPPPVPVGLHP